MKKLSLLLALVLGTTLVFAQGSAVNKAKIALDKGELDVAKDWIDQAAVHEKTVGKDKTWYYKGLIYHDLAITDNADYASLISKEDAITGAVAAYEKAIELGAGKSQYGGILTQNKIDEMWRHFVNVGAEAYDAKDYATAIKGFDYTKLVKPKDTTAYLYAGIAAQQIEEYDVALENFYGLVELGANSQDIYSSIIYLERTVKEDPDKALAMIAIAKERFPENQSYAKEEIQLLLNLDKVDEAKVKLEKAIEAEPENANLRLNLAVLYDNLHKATLDADENDPKVAEYFDAAVGNYKKTLELDSENLIGNYNLAVLYNDKANIYYKKVNAMGIKEYQKSGEAESAKGNEFIKQALPYMEKALELQPDDIDAMSALQIFYVKLKMMDKAEAISNKLSALEEGN